MAVKLARIESFPLHYNLLFIIVILFCTVSIAIALTCEPDHLENDFLSKPIWMFGIFGNSFVIVIRICYEIYRRVVIRSCGE